MRNDKIIGALIGLVGAAGNSGWTEKTDQTIASALLQEDNDETIEEIHREKYRLSPGCSTCTAPCGNTSDYDMSCFWNGSLEEQKRKHDIINELQQVAEQYNSGNLKRLPEVCILVFPLCLGASSLWFVMPIVEVVVLFVSLGYLKSKSI